MTRISLLLALVLTAATAAPQGVGSTSTGRTSGGGSGGAAAAVTPGSTTFTGCTNQLTFADPSSFLNCDTGLTYNSTTNAMAVPAAAAPTFGSDLVTNGTFTGNADSWTLGSGWSYNSNNVIHASGGGTATLAPNPALTIAASTNYSIVFTVAGQTAGTLTVTMGGSTYGSVVASGTYNFVGQTGSTANLVFTPTNLFDGTVDTVSVRQITGDSPASFTIADAAGFDVQMRSSGTGGNFFAGQDAGRWATGQNNIGIGLWTLRFLGTGIQNTIVGSQAGGGPMTGAANNTCVGYGCGTWTRDANTCIGASCGVNMHLSTGFVGLGRSTGSVAGPAQWDYSIAQGTNAKVAASNQWVVGSTTAGEHIAEAYFGGGISKASPSAFTLNGTGGSGADNAGANVVIAPGKSTGSAAPALVKIQSTTAGASSSTAQTLADSVIVGSAGRVTFGTAQDAANSIDLNQVAGGITFEAAADANEGTLVSSNVTGDRTWTLPDATTTLAGLAVTQTFTQVQGFNAGFHVGGQNNVGLLLGSGTAPAVYMNVTAITPDAPSLATGAVNVWHLAENADLAQDMGTGLCTTSNCTEPGFIVHSATVNTTEFNHLNFYGSHGGNVVALTDDTATALFHTPTMSANGQAFGGTGNYLIYVTDAGGEMQQAEGSFYWLAHRGNTGGSTCSIQHIGHDGVLPGLPLKLLSSGTLDIATNGLECNVATNVATFTMRANTSLTATTFNIRTQINVRRGQAEIIPD